MFHHFQTKLFFLNIDSEAIECEKTQLKKCEFPADIENLALDRHQSVSFCEALISDVMGNYSKFIFKSEHKVWLTVS